MSREYDIDGIIKYLQGLEDIDPDAYDGSYEFVRETVSAYTKLNDFSVLDYHDLNLVYLMAVGTWKHSIDKKKDSVDASHLPDAEKARLKRVLDSVWEKALAHGYEHSETDNASVGMFGTGFYSFQNKTTPQCVRDFISMCIDIESMDDADSMFDRAERVLTKDFKGMGAASASVVLHCLKPTVFPIMKGNMGLDSVFDAVGIKLKKKSKIETYISNARLIRSFRDKTVDFKNYRVFDIAEREIEDYNLTPEFYIDEELLEEELQIYIDEFERVDSEERYKWEAIKCFQDNFKIDADDFPSMLEASLEKSYNLLMGNMYFAKGAILEIANYDPEYTREMFRNLFDESEPILNRIKQFEEDANIYFKLKEGNPKAKNHYQTLRTITVYLFFMFPEKNYIYIPTKFEHAARQIGYKNIPKSGTIERVQAYFDMCDQIYEYIKDDDELIELNRNRLTEQCYQDPNNHVLAEDIAYFLHREYMEDAKADGPGEGFGPSLEEYDPGLTSEQYEAVFSDANIVKRRWLDVVYYVYKMGGQASCKQIASKYGNTPQHYNSNAYTVARKVIETTGCPTDVEDDGKEWFISTIFFGKPISGNEGTYIFKIRKPVEDAIKAMEKKGMFETMNTVSQTEYPKNIILYGPPGTGKTYHTTIYSVAIIEGKDLSEIQEEARDDYDSVKARYDKYMSQNQIAFTTFHQSYGYEEFIEGIKPQMDTDDSESAGDIKYVIEKGVFTSFCDQARTMSRSQEGYGFNKSPDVWKVSLGGTGDNPVRTECLKNNHIRIGWDDYGPDITDETVYSNGGRVVLNAFINRMRIGDIVFSCYSASTIDAIGVVTGEYEWHDEYEHYKRVRTVRWIARGLDFNIVDINNGATMTLATVYKLNVSLSDVLTILEDVQGETDNLNINQTYYDTEDDKRFVFIIDEMNRGNISKVFGELITLIEPSKRLGQKEELTLTLPYSKKLFGVPDNIYIIGTMNTADRSIALMDTALRRRFHFVEMLPEPSILDEIEDIEGIDVSAMLRRINKRIELLIDREHMIGHSYFLRLKENPSLGCLSEIFKNAIIPLLQEYFFDDYEKIRLILGDNQKEIENQFITRQIYDPGEYFGDAEGVDDLASYIIHADVFDSKPEAYIGIYK